MTRDAILTCAQRPIIGLQIRYSSNILQTQFCRSLQYYYQTLAAKIKNVTDWGRQNSFIPLDLDLPDKKTAA